MGDISNQLVKAVSAAAKSRTKLSIQGANSKHFLGRESGGEPLSIVEHSGIIDYQPIELVLTARAGTRLLAINNALQEHKQMLPFEGPACGGNATLGGTLACDISGPSRPWRGSVRDSTLGLRLINGRGEHLKFGGQVLKNVAGYDVSRLQAGAMGTLGVITEITFRVLPKPVASVTLITAMGASDAIIRMNRLMGRPLPLSGAAWVDDTLYLRLEGTESAIAAGIQRIKADKQSESHPIWERIRDQSLEFFLGDIATWRFSVDSTSQQRLVNQPWLIDWGGAQRWLRGSYDKGELEMMAHEMHGHVSLFRHGDRKSDVFNTLTPAMEKLQRNLKNAFDPNGILNHGRMYSWM